MKKLIALLLSLCLLLGLMPFSALAATSYDDEEDWHSYCPNCGKDGYDPYNSEYIIQQPTCTEPGLEALGYCPNGCGQVNKTIPALGHMWDYGYVAKEPTCTEEGIRVHHCQRVDGTSVATGAAGGTCGAVWNEPIAPLGHNWGEWVRTKDPTPMEKGEEKRICRRECGAEETREIDYVAPSADGATLVKSVQDPPANGEFYVYGEEIYFYLEFFYNGPEGSPSISSVSFSDAKLGLNRIAPKPIESSNHQHGSYVYLITQEDVERGYVENTAQAFYSFVGETAEHSISSNTVTLPTGKGERESYSFDDVLIEKYESSNPRNGQFYVEGETVRFEIWVRIPFTDEVATATLWDSYSETPIYQFDHPHGAGYSFQFNHVVTAGDVEAGSINNVAWIEWMTYEGSDGYKYSNYVEVPTGFDENAGSGYPTLEKIARTGPANWLYYTVGEAIDFDVILTNPADGEPLYGVTIYDIPFNGINYQEMQSVELADPLMPGEQYTASFTVTVSEKSLNFGFLENIGTAYFIRGDDGYQTDLEVRCRVPVGDENGPAFFDKMVLSNPANGMYYTPGETVTYGIDLGNTSPYDITDIKIFDNDVCIDAYDLLPSGKNNWTVFTREVSEVDAMLGFIDNIAMTDFQTPVYGNWTLWSDMVTVPTGYPWGFGVITELDVIKAETSSPKNGSYYTLGETITYTITVMNSGETDFDEVIVYDSYASGIGEIGAIELFHAGGSRSYSFAHVVTKEDVAAGYVANTAAACGYSLAGITYVTSNTVVSDTDGVPDDFGDYPGVIPPPPGSFDGPGALPGGKGDNCDCKLMKHSDGSWVYEQTYCHIHDATKTAVAEILAPGYSAGTVAIAKELWAKDIEELYEQLSNHADSLAKISLLNARNTFFAMVENKEAALNTFYPNNVQAVGTAVLQMMEDHVNTLCCLLHTAAGQRNDKEISSLPATALTAGKSCYVAREDQDGGSVMKSCALCENHMSLAQNANTLLGTMDADRAWPSIQRLWKMELQNSYSALCTELPEEKATQVAAYYRSESDYVKAFATLLEALYPDQPATVSETVSGILRDAVIEADLMMNAIGGTKEGKTISSGTGFRTK